MRVLVVGSGPAGVSAALQARELGAGVTLLEAVYDRFWRARGREHRYRQ